MRKIAIIGAGQSGLQLAISLIKQGYSISLYNDKSAEEISSGYILSSPALFEASLRNERELGLNFWDEAAPKNHSMSFNLVSDQELFLTWEGKTSHYYQAIDHRVKLPKWINTFQKLGGNFFVEKIDDLSRIETLAATNDLVIVATGKAFLSNLFEINNSETAFSKPQRALSLVYAKNVQAARNPGVKFNVIPGVGEFFCMPGLSLDGPCEMLLFEGLVDGAFDCWKNIKSPKEQFDKTLSLLKKYIPWEAERFHYADLTDEKAVLTGGYIPTIRHPVMQLPSGRSIIAMGDAVVLNDPISGQGANNANHCAKIYASEIMQREQKEFTKNWMQTTFEKYWHHAKWVTRWTNMLLSIPKPHVIEIMQSASEDKQIADYLADSLSNPVKLFPWIEHEDLTKNKISTISNNKSFTQKRLVILPIKKNMPSLEKLLSENSNQLEKFRAKNNLMLLISSVEMKNKQIRENLLDGIQIFSNYFQKVVMLRRVFSELERFTKVSQIHLEEEYNHNYTLLKDRGYKKEMWDAQLEATASWFCWKMFTLNDTGKTILIHLVLEGSANIFFQKADKVMRAYSETDYFSTHAELDEEHEFMGIKLLENLSENEYKDLLIIQEQGWDMLNLACNRIAYLATEGSTFIQKKHELISSP